MTKERVYYVLSLLMFVLSVSSIFIIGALNQHYNVHLTPFLAMLAITVPLVTFVMLGFWLWALAQTASKVRKEFSSYFYRAAPKKEDRYLMQPYVDCMLRSKAIEFMAAGDKEVDFNLKFKEAGLLSGSMLDALIKERDEIRLLIRNRKRDFWEAFNSAKANGFKVVPKVDHYRELHFDPK